MPVDFAPDIAADGPPKSIVQQSVREDSIQIRRFCASRPIENLDNDAAERVRGLCNQSASDGASRLASATSAAVKGFMGLRASTTKPML